MKKYYFNKVTVAFISAFFLAVFSTSVASILIQKHMEVGDILLLAGSLFFLSIYTRYALISFKNTPALIIDQEGIRDNQSGLVFSWQDIRSYRINNGPVASIVLELHNPSEYIKTLRNPLLKAYKTIFKKHSFSLNISLLAEQNAHILDQIEYFDLEFQRAFLESL